MDVSLDERLAFLELGAGDLEELAKLRPMLEEHADDFVACFYRHLLAFEEPRALLADPEVRGRLLEAQKQYLLSLADDKIDEAYAAHRLAIGRVHERLRVGPAWVLGAYQIYLSEISGRIDTFYANDVAAASRARRALLKRVLFDAELGLEAYTERREEQLASLNRELAREQRGLSREVAAKTEQLAETTARARAAEQLASVGMLAAGLAHEIGTPMGVIRGHAELLQGAVSDDKARWRVQTIVEQIDRITNIMQSLLNLARPQSLPFRKVELESVLETAVGFLREKLDRRGIEVVRDFVPVPEVWGDAEKLQQLFLNLVLNAADAMPDGGRLTLSITEEAGQILARVSDTGVGLEASQLERVFEPFFTTKPSGEGNGLGLVVARGIALDHGGEIEARSGVGEGSEFRVFFPQSSES